MPEQLGHDEGLIFTFRQVTQASGTLPSGYHPDHWAAHRPVGSPHIRPHALGYLMLLHLRISGTFPSAIAYCDGNTSAWQLQTNILIGDSHLSGTAPPCLFN
eukprot:SAG11_NODE_19883_length_457_cov_0.824022_1_plen_101_part_01